MVVTRSRIMSSKTTKTNNVNYNENYNEAVGFSKCDTVEVQKLVCDNARLLMEVDNCRKQLTQKSRELSVTNDILLSVEEERDTLRSSLELLRKQLNTVLQERNEFEKKLIDIQSRFFKVTDNQDFTIIDTIDYMDKD
jgi:hypothetical protein